MQYRVQVQGSNKVYMAGECNDHDIKKILAKCGHECFSANMEILNSQTVDNGAGRTFSAHYGAGQTVTLYEELVDGLSAARYIKSEDVVKLKEGRDHLTELDEVRSDKYDWSPDGFFPLKISDPMSWGPLTLYAMNRRVVDPEVTRDLLESVAAERVKQGKL